MTDVLVKIDLGNDCRPTFLLGAPNSPGMQDGEDRLIILATKAPRDQISRCNRM